MKQNGPTTRHLTVTFQNTGDKKKILQAHRQNNNSQQTIRNWITVKFFKSNSGNYKTMEQCPHYSKGKLFPTKNSIPRETIKYYGINKISRYVRSQKIYSYTSFLQVSAQICIREAFPDHLL